MNEDDTKKALSEIEKRVEHIERKLADQQTSDLQTPAELAQEAHEAAETSFQTERLGKKNVSLNSHPDAKKEIDEE